MEKIKTIAKNPNAYHNYEIIEKIECGIVLYGTEIKSIRKGKVNLKDSFAKIYNGECFVIGMHISPYEFGNIYNKDPLRDKKLLLNKSEINKLIGKVQTKGYSLVPISIYFKGKKLYDKRESIAKKDAERRMAIALKGNY